jgi:hypothetical protein
MVGYGALPKRWTVTGTDPESNSRFDLEVGDVLELTGDGDGASTSVITRHRGGVSPSIAWGGECECDCDPTSPAVKGNHNKSAGEDVFLIIFKPAGTKATHKGYIKFKGSSEGGTGTWTAEEGG